MLQGWVPYAIIAVAAAILIAGTVVLARLAWRRQVRRYIVNLVGRREAISAALKMTQASISRLAGGSVAEVLAFSSSSSEERRALAEIASRMRIEQAELRDLALPKVLWPLADQLGEAASCLSQEVGRVGDAEGESVLDALAALDLKRAREALAAAETETETASLRYGLTDPAVYGGGLYI